MADLPPIHNSAPRPETGPVGDGAISPAESPTSTQQRVSRGRSLLVWSLRWAILGFATGGAWGLGLVAAQLFPASNPSPPLQEVVLRRSHRTLQKLRRLPEWWAGEPRRATIGAAPLPALPDPVAPVSRPITLTEAQQEQVSAELAAVQEDLQSLRDRTSALETQLGLPTLSLPVEDRLQTLENRLTPPGAIAADPEAPTANPAPDTSAESRTTPPPADPPDPLFQPEAYRVTLPSDVLFSPGEAVLQTNAQPLLDNILLDVGRYPGATILVGSYSDGSTGTEPGTSMSFQQAIAVQRYLAQRLGDQDYHWVTVGYGAYSNLGATGGSQLSRRVAIAIIPR